MSTITAVLTPLRGGQDIYAPPTPGDAPSGIPDGWRPIYVRARGESWPLFVHLASGLAFVALDEEGAPVHAYEPLAPLSVWRLPDGEVSARRRGITTDDEPESLAVPAACLVWLAARLWGPR